MKVSSVSRTASATWRCTSVCTAFCMAAVKRGAWAILLSEIVERAALGVERGAWGVERRLAATVNVLERVAASHDQRRAADRPLLLVEHGGERGAEHGVVVDDPARGV